MAMDRVDGREQLTGREPSIHLLFHVSIDAYLLARGPLGALIVLSYLLLGQDVTVPRLCYVSQ